MKLFRTNFCRRALVRNAGMVAGAGLLGLGTGATWAICAEQRKAACPGADR